MGIEFSLIKFENVSLKAGALLKKVAGVLWPDRLIDIAEAESAARKIEARTDLEIERMKAEHAIDLASDLQQRAKARHFAEQIRYQENIERITMLSLPDVKPEAEPDKIDDEWIERFFERARGVSNAVTQILWARILAGEANRPGSISKRTLDFLSSMEKGEGESFAKLVNFSVTGVGDSRILIVTNIYDDMYKNNGLQFETLTHLQSIGLIVFDSHKGFGFVVDGYTSTSAARYFTKTIVAEWLGSRVNLPAGQAFFTQIGRELSAVCEPVEIPGFAEHLVEFWKARGAQKVYIQPSEPVLILRPNPAS